MVRVQLYSNLQAVIFESLVECNLRYNYRTLLDRSPRIRWNEIYIYLAIYSVQSTLIFRINVLFAPNKRILKQNSRLKDEVVGAIFTVVSEEKLWQLPQFMIHVSIPPCGQCSWMIFIHIYNARMRKYISQAVWTMWIITSIFRRSQPLYI